MSADKSTLPRQGDVWWAEVETHRRPVLVVSRPGAEHYLKRLVVAPITRTRRDIPTQIDLDERHGLDQPCAASFDNLTTVPIAVLTERVGQLAFGRSQICAALSALAYC